jgi:transposase
MTLDDIRKKVRKTGKKMPCESAVREAAATFTSVKQKVGRRKGWRKTSKIDDKRIIKAFHKVRPPGHGVDSRKVHTALPKNVKKKICKRTVIRRLAEKGIKPQPKLNKKDFSEAQIKKRVAFGKKYQDWTGAKWTTELQAVGDMKEFTYYPKDLKPRQAQLKAPWTYMTKAERRKPAFQRPKRWFPKEVWKATKKQKVFGITTSNGHKLAFLVPKPWSTALWAKEIKARLIPFLKNAFRGKTSFKILLDGEGLLHGPEAKAEMAKANVSAFPDWAGYSPDLNPQENVWAWAENDVRAHEKNSDSFEMFQKRVLKSTRSYPTAYAKKLVPGMAKRMKKLLKRQGGHIGK